MRRYAGSTGRSAQGEILLMVFKTVFSMKDSMRAWKWDYHALPILPLVKRYEEAHNATNTLSLVRKTIRRLPRSLARQIRRISSWSPEERGGKRRHQGP